MKKLITICFLIATTLTVKAQNFQTTENEVNRLLGANKITVFCHGMEHNDINRFKIEELGRIIYHNSSEELPEYPVTMFHLVEIYGYSINDNSVVFYDDYEEEYLKLTGLDKNEGKQLVKLLEKLDKICNDNLNEFKKDFKQFDGLDDITTDKWKKI
ncbi:hypothetical protein FEDK69T_15130 [Flavobacterium enshiense DK69]|uniref:DUF4825 domain-containing protein n=1 Tax=Flavobacterium enshiense DK69 TaxID=1107311 RepID=V6S9N0_9FLAO|nr:hypothetical protein [Flavobacterium enshiense]ESU23351.1 hypothetical protein FEDK69T_15130 [Flavobacterium enshiense DK69]KGO96417.1 hypothetical protein Q767_05790 [Flavobacterium enshiense DK69]